MSNSGIWIVFTKSKALDGCSINIDGSEFFFTEAFVPFDGNKNSIEVISYIFAEVKQALFEKKLVLSEISKCMHYTPDEWSGGSEMDIEIRRVAQIAVEINEITFNVFRTQDVQENFIYTFQVKELD